MNNKTPNPSKEEIISPKVFIGSLPKNTNYEDLHAHISNFGEVIFLQVKRKETNGECLGYGHAEVSHRSYEALLKQKSSTFMGRKITFQPFFEGSKLKNHLVSLNSKRIYVRNIPKNSSQESLLQLFTQFGEIQTAYLRNIPGSRKSVGVILFSDPKKAEIAVEEINKTQSGVFMKMNATYQFITNFKRKKNQKYLIKNDLIDHKQDIRIKPRRDYIKPGMRKYKFYEENHIRHLDYSNVKINRPVNKFNLNEYPNKRNQKTKGFNFGNFKEENITLVRSDNNKWNCY